MNLDLNSEPSAVRVLLSPPHLTDYFQLNFQRLSFILTSSQRLWFEDYVSVSVITKSLSISINIRRQKAVRGSRRMIPSGEKEVLLSGSQTGAWGRVTRRAG